MRVSNVFAGVKASPRIEQRRMLLAGVLSGMFAAGGCFSHHVPATLRLMGHNAYEEIKRAEEDLKAQGKCYVKEEADFSIEETYEELESIVEAGKKLHIKGKPNVDQMVLADAYPHLVTKVESQAKSEYWGCLIGLQGQLNMLKGAGYETPKLEPQICESWVEINYQGGLRVTAIACDFLMVLTTDAVIGGVEYKAGTKLIILKDGTVRQKSR